MAHLVTLDAYLSLGGTEVSAHFHDLTARHSVDLQDDTVFGDTMKQRLVGVQDYDVQVAGNNDYTDNDLDEDIEALIAAACAVAWRPVNTTIGAGNPEYQFTGLIPDVTKTHNHGQVAGISLNVLNSSTASVTRDVTP